MKHLLIFLLLIICSCSDTTKYDHYEITYVMYYPRQNDTITGIVRTNEYYRLRSTRGTNTLSIRRGNTFYIEQSTVPIKVLTFKKQTND